MAYSFLPLQQKVIDIGEWLKGEFSAIRTGRATPSILDNVSVESYGSRMSIRELASVNVEDPRTLRIVPWDMTQGKNIENGITDKKSIANRVNSKVRLNGTAHYIRRYLLHNGIRDNVNKSHTEYFIEGNEKTIKQDLFSNVK